MHATVYYINVLVLSIFGLDAYFDITVETEMEKFPAWMEGKNCDAHNVVHRKTGNVRVTLKPTDKFHNVFEDYETLSVVMPAGVARDLIRTIKMDGEDKMWFTKDRINYAAKYHKVL